MNTELVSIIVPIYGVEEYLPKCIESLIHQTFENIEIILVDDGSKDNSSSICDKYSIQDSRIIVLHKENGGLVSARKAGLSISKGKYIGFVDGDDWVSVDYVKNLYNAISKNDAELVISGHLREFFGKVEKFIPKTSIGVYDKERIKKEILPIAIYNGKFFQHGISTYVWNKLFLRDKLKYYLDSVNNSIVMGEDAAITYPYLFSTDKLVIIDTSDYYYRQRPNSIVKSLSKLENEYGQISLLFQHLFLQLVKPEFEFVNLQLKLYFFTQIVIRSGGVIGNSTDDLENIPFPKIKNGSKIVIYSSGSFGQHLISTLQKYKIFSIVAWLDDDHIESQIFGLEVESIDQIKEIEYDLILIASIDLEFSNKVVKQLVKKGVNPDKISIFQLDVSKMEKLIQNIGFNINSFEYKNIYL